MLLGQFIRRARLSHARRLHDGGVVCVGLVIRVVVLFCMTPKPGWGFPLEGAKPCTFRRCEELRHLQCCIFKIVCLPRICGSSGSSSMVRLDASISTGFAFFKNPVVNDIQLAHHKSGDVPHSRMRRIRPNAPFSQADWSCFTRDGCFRMYAAACRKPLYS